MKLSDNEIRDITRLLEQGKPLPEAYRFLLFEDKREVELVWNGKTNEVCNVVLPFQVIEQVDEPRAEKPEDTQLQSKLFETDARAAAEGLDQQADLGRQQAGALFAEEWPAARGNREAGGHQ